jgi:hypothetical protein
MNPLSSQTASETFTAVYKRIMPRCVSVKLSWRYIR